ncbi:hypothetical protein ACO1O0_001560 [Amphichorda felina]
MLLLTGADDKSVPELIKGNQRDIRDSSLFRDLGKHFHDLHSPAFGKISDASDVELSPDGQTVIFTGSIWTKLEGVAQKRICVTEVNTGKTNIITNGPNNDMQPKWSPDSQTIAFISDRASSGIFHLFLLSSGQLGEAKPVHLPQGLTAEYAAWSPSGGHILIGAAGQGADQAGGSGSGTLNPTDDSQLPAWMPHVEPDTQKNVWRTIFVYDVAEGDLNLVSPSGVNVWEATWCGPGHIAAIASHDPSESSWYKTTIDVVDIKTRQSETIYRGSFQLGIPSATPSGSRIAVIDGLFSDRGIVAGTPVLIDVASHLSTRVETGGIDVSQMSWIDEQNLFFVGLRSLHAVSGRIDTKTNTFNVTWTTPDGLGARYPQASQLVNGSFAVARSSWTRYPEIGLVRDTSGYETLASLDHDGAKYLRSICGSAEEVSWSAPDGTEIQGYLCLPKSEKKEPHPLVLHVHGGPVWAFTNAWQLKFPWVPLLVSRGYAVLSANPRGSRGRGDDFAHKVQGDMGGDDMGDLLSGIDALVERGVVDPSRLGVTGGSYGGFMSAWIITQTKRFAASVAIAPCTDWLSQHTTSNIPAFDKILLQDNPYALEGEYTRRSPLRHVQACSTPLLQLVGTEDQCTPASQAVQFHNSLLEHGIESVIVQYPGEGHGVRKFPAVIDYCCRMVSWFQKHMPA